MAVENYMRLECKNYGSNKFWEGWLEPDVGKWVFCARWGKIGTKGQLKSWPFSTRFTASSKLNLKIAEKFGKGYLDVTSPFCMADDCTKTAQGKASLCPAHLAEQISKTMNPSPAVKTMQKLAKPEPKYEPVAADDTLGFLDFLGV